MSAEEPTDGRALLYIAESVRNMKTPLLCMLLVTAAAAEIHQNSGSATPLPHQKYIHVVSEADSPVQQTYIKSKDGLYIAAARSREGCCACEGASLYFYEPCVEQFIKEVRRFFVGVFRQLKWKIDDF